MAFAANISEEDLRLVFKRYANTGEQKDQIDKSSFAKMVSKLGVGMSKNELRVAFDEVDGDGGGTLGFDEFSNFISTGSKGGDAPFEGLASALVLEVQAAKNAMALAASISEADLRIVFR